MNVTLTLDETLIREARHEAVEQGISLSALVAESLRRELQRKALYQRSKQHSLRAMEEGVDLGGRPLARDEIYEERTGPQENS